MPPRYLRAACVLDLAFRLLWVANTGVEASGTLASGTHETLFAAACVEINQWNALSSKYFKPLYLGQIEVDSADFWTNRLLSSSSRSTAKKIVSKHSNTRTLKSG